MAEGVFDPDKIVYRGGPDSTIDGFIAISKRLGLGSFSLDVLIDTLKGRYEVLACAMESLASPPRVERYDRFSNDENRIPRRFGYLKPWHGTDDWESSDNIQVLKRYMGSIAEKIRLDVGPEATVVMSVRPAILALYTEMYQIS